MPQPVEFVGDHYQLLDQLGEYSKIVRYKAVDIRLQRHVIIIMLSPHYEHSEQALARFKSEAKILVTLSDPNIPKILDYGEFEGYPYLVTEYTPENTTQSPTKDSFFQEIFLRLAGESTTDAPPPDVKKKKK